LAVVGRSPKEETDFALILFVVEQRLKDGEFIDADEVASCIEMVGDAPLPTWLRKLACGHLTGGLKRPRGRPSVKNEWQERLLPLAQRDYHRMLRLLQQRAKRRVAPKKASRLDGPPHERALELVHRHYKNFGEFRSIDLRRFRALISSRK
jgi:hypothetical protein